jgi:hypothetical protein
VIRLKPDFWVGFKMRALDKQQAGDEAGAKADEARACALNSSSCPQ